jgi:hypothetical protein
MRQVAVGRGAAFHALVYDMFTLELARRYTKMGLCIIPVHPRSKQPYIKWQRYQTTRPTDKDLVRWFDKKERNAAILLGKVSSVIVVDTDTPEAEAWVVKNLPRTPMMTHTAKGYHRFYRFPLAAYDNPTSIPSHIRFGKDQKLEIRRDGHYVVAPGSIHETGWEYVEGGADPTEEKRSKKNSEFIVRAWPKDYVVLPELPDKYTTSGGVGSGVIARRFGLPPVIVKSERHLTIWKLLRSLKARNIKFGDAIAFCHHINRERCQPVIDSFELEMYLRRGWNQSDQAGFAPILLEAETAPRPSWIQPGDIRGTEHLHVSLETWYIWQEKEDVTKLDTLEPEDVTKLDTLEPENTSQLDSLEPEDFTKLDHI